MSNNFGKHISNTRTHPLRGFIMQISIRLQSLESSIKEAHFPLTL